MTAVQFSGRVWKDGKFWLVEVPALDATTQGRTRKEALYMIADYVKTAVNRRGFKVYVIEAKDGVISVMSDDIAAMTALMLRRQREASGLTLADVAHRLGQKSHNAYARYEQGVSVPTVDKLAKLLHAIHPEHVMELG